MVIKGLLSGRTHTDDLGASATGNRAQEESVRRTGLPLVILIDLLGEESSELGEVVFTGLEVRNEHIG